MEWFTGQAAWDRGHHGAVRSLRAKHADRGRRPETADRCWARCRDPAVPDRRTNRSNRCAAAHPFPLGPHLWHSRYMADRLAAIVLWHAETSVSRFGSDWSQSLMVNLEKAY